MSEDNLFNRVIPIDIEKEVKKSFLEYSMSVIVSRALPDVRDGMKPVHRRILYALYDQGMTHDKPHKKSANIVGEVMGKYHPHGDAAIYQTMVKMAQDFAIRYPLVDGHGNFGSVDGDSAAAMRYTESRMSKLAAEMLRDIDKDTVDWRPNYDDTREEPAVLPARFPNLIVNGGSGIAVGMATNMLPHNLREVVEGIKMVIDDPDIEVSELMKAVPGPDFPTGGIMGQAGIKQAFETGRGSVKVRSRYEIEERKGGKQAIIVTEIPYQVNKSRLVEKIAELVRDKKIDGITDLRDESDRNGIRIVIEVRRDTNVNVLINKLFKHTQLEDSFGIINLALVNGEPRILTLKQLMEHYLDHRKDVITRRCSFDLNNALNRRHILEGLRIAIDNLDEIVRIIRASRERESARRALMESFGLSDKQANAILDMRMVQLTGLEREKLEEEYRQILLLIADLEDILASPARVLDIIREDLDEISEKFGDDRRTEITRDNMDYEEEDFIEDHEAVITISNRGYIKRQPLDTYQVQKRGGKGIRVAPQRDEEVAVDVLVTGVLNHILFFTNQGRAFSTKAWQIPEFTRQARGQALVNFLELRPGEHVSTVLPVHIFDENRFLMMVTRKGIVKKVTLSAFENIRKNGLIAINLSEDDALVRVLRVQDEDKVIIISAQGQAIMFEQEQVRPMGRTAAGVIGIRLNYGDEVIGADKARPESEVVLVTREGYGKRTKIDEYRLHNRGGKGIRTIDISELNGPVVGFQTVRSGEEIVILSSQGQIVRLEIEDISTQKRYSRGVMLMRTSEEDQVVAIACFKIEKEE
ncbi:MAG: DNA gyrase subunit A [Syntrophomonadaceae bacterium]|nr:DNA gyrase subunit A [Syntrophomonadaceae bacterium]